MDVEQTALVRLKQSLLQTVQKEREARRENVQTMLFRGVRKNMHGHLNISLQRSRLLRKRSLMTGNGVFSVPAGRTAPASHEESAGFGAEDMSYASAI